jgi:hypothetical protein
LFIDSLHDLVDTAIVDMPDPVGITATPCGGKSPAYDAFFVPLVPGSRE